MYSRAPLHPERGAWRRSMCVWVGPRGRRREHKGLARPMPRKDKHTKSDKRKHAQREMHLCFLA